MADKDFAQRDKPQFEAENNISLFRSKSILIAILALMFAIISFATGFFMGEKLALETNKGNKHQALLETLQNQKEELAGLKEEAEKWRQKEADTSQVGELTFYNELPKQSIIPEPLHGKSATKNAPKNNFTIPDNVDDIAATETKLNAIIEREMSTSTRKFRIQLASFVKRSDSENLALQLKKVGVATTIQRVSLVDLGVRYRVNTTPFEDHQHAVRAKKLVKDKFGITGIIISR